MSGQVGVAEVLAAMVGHEQDCPECRQGKHGNCTGWSIDEDTDEIVDCPCAVGGHA